MFGSGASHGIYAQFIAQSTIANKRAIGLLRGSGNRMGNWFYAMHRALRLKDALVATIHQSIFATLSIVKTDDRVRLAVMDVKSPTFWKSIYVLLRSVYPALRTLRYCDSNTPAMDKIFFLSHRVSCALQNSVEKLNDEELFLELEDDDGVAFEHEQVFGSTVSEEESAEEEDDEESGFGSDDE